MTSTLTNLLRGAVAAFALTAAASAVTLDYMSEYKLGIASPGLPSGAGHEVERLQQLVDWYNAGESNGMSAVIDGDTITLQAGSGVADAPLPAVVFGFKNEDDVLADVDVSGYTYLMAKYGAGPLGQISVYFYVGGLTTINVAENIVIGGVRSGGLSHWSLFNHTPSVPDEAGTLFLLLAGLGALVAWRSRRA